MNKREDKPIIWKAIVCIVPCSVVFSFSRTVLTFLITMLGVIIYKIPLLGDLLSIFFMERGDNIFTFAIIVSVFVAYLLTTFIQNKMMKDVPTNILSRRILGIIIGLIHLFSLVVNISNGDSFYVNIILIITALVFIFGKKEN